ncbi:unnamed protein product, partial [Effrenium voratum]
YCQPRLGEQFAQPFVDRRVRDRLRELLLTKNPQLQAQVLQTIHILLAATPAESTLFCNLTAGWYLRRPKRGHRVVTSQSSVPCGSSTPRKACFAPSIASSKGDSPLQATPSHILLLHVVSHEAIHLTPFSSPDSIH